MRSFTGGYNNDAQRQRMATQRVCGAQAEDPNHRDGGKRLAEPVQGTKKQLIGTLVGISAVILALVLKALHVF